MTYQIMKILSELCIIFLYFCYSGIALNEDICDIMQTNMGNYIICLLITGIYAKISNINIIRQKHLVRLCHDFELFVKFKIYKIKWYDCTGEWAVKTEEEKVEQSHKVQVITLTCIYLVWFFQVKRVINPLPIMSLMKEYTCIKGLLNQNGFFLG